MFRLLRVRVWLFFDDECIYLHGAFILGRDDDDISRQICGIGQTSGAGAAVCVNCDNAPASSTYDTVPVWQPASMPALHTCQPTSMPACCSMTAALTGWILLLSVSARPHCAGEPTSQPSPQCVCSVFACRIV